MTPAAARQIISKIENQGGLENFESITGRPMP